MGIAWGVLRVCVAIFLDIPLDFHEVLSGFLREGGGGVSGDVWRCLARVGGVVYTLVNGRLIGPEMIFLRKEHEVKIVWYVTAS